MVTIRHKIELEAFFLIAVVGAVSLFYVIRANKPLRVNINMPAAASPISSVIPTIIPEEKTEISSQVSPDGAKKLIMKKTVNKDIAQIYTFSVTDGNGLNEQVIFSKTLDAAKSMTIPFNTWSPDNKYFFIQENAKDDQNIMVFKVSGEPFGNEEAYLDATDLFEKKNTGNNFKEATGWASETLIIINTTKEDKTKGPSYWFEVPSKAIIQLSSEF